MASPPPGMDHQQTQQWANDFQARLRSEGRNPAYFGFGPPAAAGGGRPSWPQMANETGFTYPGQPPMGTPLFQARPSQPSSQRLQPPATFGQAPASALGQPQPAGPPPFRAPAAQPMQTMRPGVSSPRRRFTPGMAQPRQSPYSTGTPYGQQPR